MRTCETDRVRLGILYVCSKKRISRPGIGAGCAGTDLTTSEVIVWVILIHADLATIFPGAAPKRRTETRKIPAPVTGTGCAEVTISRAYSR